MKLALIVSLFSFVASAAYVQGSKCGLVDNTEDYEITAKRTFDPLKKAAILALPTLTKQQIIIAAKTVAASYGEEVEFRDSFQAASYMERGRGGFTIIHALAGRTMITEVRAYPGDNAQGILFEQGTKHIVGENGDDDITCK